MRAVGETGLDFFRTAPTGAPPQEESFRRHIAMAKDARARRWSSTTATPTTTCVRVLDSEGAPDTVVFHCFSGDPELARTCADRGWYLSFAGTVTFKNAANLRAALSVAPLDRLLVETDAPFLTPEPYRGKPNASYLVPHTIRAMAGVLGSRRGRPVHRRGGQHACGCSEPSRPYLSGSVMGNLWDFGGRLALFRASVGGLSAGAGKPRRAT